jgi:hypothetical protein
LLAAATQAKDAPGELLLWEVASRRLLARYSLAGGSVAALRFSPDGRYIALGGWDAPIWLWGVP